MHIILCIFVYKVTDLFYTKYMVSTYSSRKDKKMVSKEISDYFTKLVEPLVTTQTLEEIFGKLKQENHWKIQRKIHCTELENSGFGGENWSPREKDRKTRYKMWW